MKYLVVDTRDNTRLFGEVTALDATTESAFNVDKTDFVNIGSGAGLVSLPAVAIRAYPGITECPKDAIDCG